MAITPWIPNLAQIEDGTDVKADVVNSILKQYAHRTQYLYDKFGEFGDKSVLLAHDQPVYPASNSDVGINRLVYFRKTGSSEGFDLAKVEFVVNPERASSLTPSKSSYSLGLVKQASSTGTVDLFLNGLVELAVPINDASSGLLTVAERSLPFSPGPLFLSANEPGSATRNPSGAIVYVGYAISPTKLLFTPSVQELSKFFTSYQFSLIDRPIGEVTTVGSPDATVSVTSPDYSVVGWASVDNLSASMQLLAPAGAKFFYYFPNVVDLLADTTLTPNEREDQYNLLTSLPPVPINQATVIVNGIIQTSRDDDEIDGTYKITELGIWWFSDKEGYQPWAYDYPTAMEVVADVAQNQITKPAHKFLDGDVVAFESNNGTLPSGIVAGREYYVIDATADTFKISDTENGVVVPLIDNGSGDFRVKFSYIWKWAKSQTLYRPRTTIQFTKINPDFRNSTVSSLRKYNAGSNALELYRPDRTTLSDGYGDILIRLLLNYAIGNVQPSSTAVRGISYDEATGRSVMSITPVISKLTEGAGITITPVTIGGNVEPGSYIISSSVNSTSGRVVALEPDGAELKYEGLHSYLKMESPNVLPSSVTGKILLTADTPNADMTFVLLLTAFENLSTTRNIDFIFSYNVTKAGTLIGTGQSNATVTVALPAPYTARTVFKAGNSIGAINVPNLRIPASAIQGGDLAVNFKLARAINANNPLNSPIGLVDLYWKIG